MTVLGNAPHRDCLYNIRMLFFLTGDIQTGKTRWLTSVLDELCSVGVEPAGVMAPGIWRDLGPQASPRFEKLGIDNVLLPEGEFVPFARREDLALVEGSFDESSQSARAQLHWAIDDTAISRVNAHFDELGERALAETRTTPSLLVIDELGRLELLRGEGITSALQLLDGGATPAFPHALAIVRSDLLPAALERFAGANWNGMQVIHADEEGRAALLEAFGETSA